MYIFLNVVNDSQNEYWSKFQGSDYHDFVVDFFLSEVHKRPLTPIKPNATFIIRASSLFQNIGSTHAIPSFTSRDPNDPAPTSDLPVWPRYTLPDQEYKILSPAMENGRAMRMDTCSFWMDYAPTLYNYGKQSSLYLFLIFSYNTCN